MIFRSFAGGSGGVAIALPSLIGEVTSNLPSAGNGRRKRIEPKRDNVLAGAAVLTKF
jgi:hypothetical protein